MERQNFSYLIVVATVILAALSGINFRHKEKNIIFVPYKY